ncbi:hypothetical protein [Sciscionella marina]|uniref:hypothetical protein n=1 Tax=Sciscionella marina TaxID=508770 RepID=UPI0012F6355B|nr:hypothetical protein [Sciscionella marina]
MAGDLQYDAAGMRSALTMLRDLIARLDEERGDLGGLDTVRAPGTAPATERFHERYLDWVGEVSEEHAATREQAQRAVDALIAIDLEYNAGELANELGLRTHLHADAPGSGDR